MKSNYSSENFMGDNILACYLRVSDEDFDLRHNVLKDESTSIRSKESLMAMNRIPIKGKTCSI